MIDYLDNIGIQWLMGSDSAFLDHFALTLTHAIIWLPLYLALIVMIIKNNDNMSQIILCIGCAFLCVIISAQLCNAVVKPLVARPRPCNTPTVMFLSQIAGNIHSKDFSFYSSHATNTMSLAVYITLVVRSHKLTAAMLLWSILCCWTRLYLAQHYLTDILVGLFVGAIIGALSYYIYQHVYRTISPDRRFVSTQYTATGYLHADIDIVLSSMAIVVVYSLLPI